MLWLLIFVYPDIQGSNLIQQAAITSTEGTSNQTLIFSRIASWEKANLNQGILTPLLSNPSIMRLREGDANWIATICVGKCGEFADLFYAIATRAGIQSRIVIDSADDHQWNEYFDTARREWV